LNINILHGFSLACLQHFFLTSALIFPVEEILPALYYVNNCKVCPQGKPHSFQKSVSHDQAESALFSYLKKNYNKKKWQKADSILHEQGLYY